MHSAVLESLHILLTTMLFLPPPPTTTIALRPRGIHDGKPGASQMRGQADSG